MASLHPSLAVCRAICVQFLWRRQFTNELALTAPPLAAMAQASALSVAACLAATAIPLRRIAGLQIVEAVETAN